TSVWTDCDKKGAAESRAVRPALGGYERGDGATSPRRFTWEWDEWGGDGSESRPLSEHLLQLIVNELHLGSDDDLAGVLAGTDNAGSTCILNGLFINSGVVVDLETQTGCAVLNILDVALAAHSCQDARSDLGV